MKNNKYIGSSFESFLEEEGIFEEATVAAVKSALARNPTKMVKQAEQKSSKK